LNLFYDEATVVRLLLRMRWKTPVLLITTVLVLLPGANARAQVSTDDSTFDAITRQGIDEVYNLKFEEAEKTFHQLVILRPGQPAGYFFQSMITWWRIVIDMEDTHFDDRFLEGMDFVTDMCDSILDKHPGDVTALFFKGGAIGFKGRLEFHRNDYLSAANAGRKALPIVQAASELDPRNYDILLGTGMYNYYAEVIPSEYPLLKPLLLFVPRGDRAKGLEQIAIASEKGKYASIEASYLLLQIYYYYEKDYGKALNLALKLFKRFPDNVLFHRYCGRCEYSAGDWPAVRAVFGEIQQRVRAGQRGYNSGVEREATYYVGLSKMIQKNFDEALVDFYRCDELSRLLDTQEVSGFMVMSNLKIGQIYDLQGRRDAAVQQYKKVLAMKEYQDSHAQAEKFMNDPATY